MPRFLQAEAGLFRGEEEFLSRLKQLQPAQMIRVYNYGRGARDEEYFVLGSEGVLYNARTKQIVDPKIVLSKDYAPNGWCFDSFEIDALPKGELEKILGF